MGDAEVLGPVEYAGTSDTEGADDASSGSAADGAEEAGMWGSSIGIVGGGPVEACGKTWYLVTMNKRKLSRSR